MRKLIAIFVMLLVTAYGSTAWAGANEDLTGANAGVSEGTALARQGDFDGAKSAYERFRQRWLEIEDGIKEKSKTAYRSIEDEMGQVQFALLQNPIDQNKLIEALTGLKMANRKFISGGYPIDGDGGQGAARTGSVADLLTILDQARERIEADDAAGAAEAVDQFRNSWLEVEGIVLTQSAKIYADAEKDMVDAYALLAGKNPDLKRALNVINGMREYLAPIAGKTSYTLFDASTILLREGLEALLVIVSLLAFLNKSGYRNQTGWVWGGVLAGLAVSVALALAVHQLFGAGVFGNNNFLIAGWTGLFAAVMLIYVSYWLHSKSSVAEWQRYIQEKSTAALATGKLLSLAFLAFLALSIIKIGLKIPVRPFFLVSSLLVFYLALKFTGMGIHGLQLAGVLPATVAPYLPTLNFLAVYPNWESTLPQIALLLAGAAMAILGYLRDRAFRRQMSPTQTGGDSNYNHVREKEITG